MFLYIRIILRFFLLSVYQSFTVLQNIIGLFKVIFIYGTNHTHKKKLGELYIIYRKSFKINEQYVYFWYNKKSYSIYNRYVYDGLGDYSIVYNKMIKQIHKTIFIYSYA